MYFPFDGTKYQPQMGLKPLDLRGWIEVDDQYDAYIDLKKKLFNSERDTVFQILPEAESIAFELFNEVRAHLKKNYSYLRNPDLIPKNGADALIELSKLTQEDWTILSATAPVKLIAGSVCFPSRWSLKEKMNQQSGFIHAPIPAFNTIAKPTESFLERITVDRPAWRLNWTIHDSAALFSPPGHTPKLNITVENSLDSTFLRVERQTLRRLPKTGGLIFSIRTYITRTSEVAKDSQNRKLMLATLETLDEATVKYKGMSAFYNALLTALAYNS